MSSRVLMLTPDIGFLDRRIVQEAASLARVGFSVDIYPTSDESLAYDGPLLEGVRLLSNPGPPAVPGRTLATMRTVKRRVGAVVPAVNRVVELVRYRLLDS